MILGCSLCTTSLISLNDKSFHIKKAIVQGLKKLLKMQKWKASNLYGRHLFTGFPLKILFLWSKAKMWSFQNLLFTICSKLIKWDFFFPLQSSNIASLNA